MSDSFGAFLVKKSDAGFTAGVQQLSLGDLPAGDVTVRVRHSSVIYKDGLALLPESPVVAVYPMVPGIDLAGVVTESSDPRWYRPQAEVPGSERLSRGRSGRHPDGRR
jgi:NADPH:quinone reductase-like Zn-dependent oxidoreductase